MTITARSHPRSDISEIKRRADIREVWAALGGGQLRCLRGQAWWRGGDGYNVVLYPSRSSWHDYVTGDGGDVIALVQAVRQCGFPEATEWLADHTGAHVCKWIRRDRSNNLDWENDLRWATWWGISALALAEWALEELPCDDLQRPGLTGLIRSIRLGESSLVHEYREWRRSVPTMTAAMARAGKLHDARVQRRLARWLVTTHDQTAT